MTAPARLYVGAVVHARLRPKPHRFRYRVFALHIDLERLDEAARLSPLFCVDRWNLLSFHTKDHGDRGLRPLADWARARFAAHGIAAERVTLMTYPRILGYAFVPMSVFYAHAPDGAVTGALAEVRNTFGERHVYVLPSPADGGRPSAQKVFHVSPFLGMDHVYRFGLVAPGSEARVSVVEHDARGPVLTAVFAGRARALTTRGLLATLARTPLMTFKVVAAIHVEALRLWAKGIAVVPHPRRRARKAAAREA